MSFNVYILLQMCCIFSFATCMHLMMREREREDMNLKSGTNWYVMI